MAKESEINLMDNLNTESKPVSKPSAPPAPAPKVPEASTQATPLDSLGSASTPATENKQFNALPNLSSPLSGGNNSLGYTFKKEKSSSIHVDFAGVKNAILNFIVPLVCLGLITLIFLVFLYPSFKAIPTLNEDLKTTQGLEAQLSGKLDNLNRLVDFKSVVDENSDLVNKVLVSESAVPALLTQIDQISKNSGLEINRLSYSLTSSDPDKGSSYNIVNVNLSVGGNINQTMSFIRDVENASRLINIDTVRYSVDEKDGNLAVTSDFVLSSPYLFVESDAVTDEPVDLDISSQAFKDLISKLKEMRYYDASAPISFELPTEEVPLEVTPVPEDIPSDESIF